MKHSTDRQPTDQRLAIAVRGVIQGVGFRPFVYNAARAAGLTGWVRNEADTVRIEVQGEPDRLETFVHSLRHAHPPQARIDSLEICQRPCEDGATQTFQIRSSAGRAAPRPTIPADLATCAECVREIRSPAQRRYGYPFTNCTNCGPRWSIIEQLPYDRPRTSMARFAMCPDCRTEYEDPADRRFHAQPIACPRCGPALRLLSCGRSPDRATMGRGQRPAPNCGDGSETAVGQEALDAAVEAVLAGRVVAVKGLGGFQLLVDATNAQADALLRNRKQRPHQPIAQIHPTLEEVRSRCQVSDAEARALASHQAPILLLRRRDDGDKRADVVEAVAPRNPYLGVMLPYTPLHHLLTAAIDRPIVCTSGNLSEEPMAISTGDALGRLGPIADVLLTHNRPIVRPVDDSVARVGPDGLQVLRRARGFAPLPIELGLESPTILAVGGHLKNTVALALGSGRVRETHHETESIDDSSPRSTHPTQVVMSPHVGDLDNVLGVEVHRRAIRDLVDFFEAVPEVVACDLHPDYASTREAEALAAGWDVPLVRVQHHQAHVAACVAEHRLEGPVLGLAWDGTGYGTDGTVWGGEALICQRAEFTRTAHLRTFALPGGDKAVRQPRRSALGVLFEILAEQAAEDATGWFSPSELDTLLSLLARGVHAPRTSSMGRLFDAVAVMCGLPAVISFEGQAAMALEFAADKEATHAASHRNDAYPLPLSDELPAVADWEPLVRGVLSDRAAGEPAGRISVRFHNALAELAVAVARRSGCSRVVLSGGCFQNALLTDRVRGRLLESGFSVYTHRRVPPGDGGIALGQVAVAARQLEAS